jgi:hypothetical protein
MSRSRYETVIFGCLWRPLKTLEMNAALMRKVLTCFPGGLLSCVWRSLTLFPYHACHGRGFPQWIHSPFLSRTSQPNLPSPLDSPTLTVKALVTNKTSVTFLPYMVLFWQWEALQEILSVLSAKCQPAMYLPSANPIVLSSQLPSTLTSHDGHTS